MQLPVTIDTLAELDSGAARLIINRAIEEAVRDMDDRGDDGKPRKVEILLELSRMDNGLIACHVEASPKVPRRRTASTVGLIRRSGERSQLLFQQFDQDDPKQRTIDEAEGKNDA